MSDRILVVDDEVEIADLIETYLQSEDYVVYKFYSAREIGRASCRERVSSPV